jgi:hypothetical protein
VEEEARRHAALPPAQNPLDAITALQQPVCMARKLRIQYPGAIYHVMNPGERWLVPGIGTGDIVAKLGKPASVRNASSQELWQYRLEPFPADDEIRGTYVVGVEIIVTNQKLANWNCTYLEHQGPSGNKALPGGDAAELNSPIIVSTNQIPKGPFIDTVRCPRLGFIGPNPDLAISIAKDVTLETRPVAESYGSNALVWEFSIKLTDLDSVRLKRLTTRNIDQKLLIMLGDEPISAPRVVVPIDNGTLVVGCSEQLLMETIDTHLRAMPRQPLK